MPKPMGIPIRNFRISHTSKGWYWKWSNMPRAVGPFPTLPEALADLQQHPFPNRYLTAEEKKIIGRTHPTIHDPTTGPCPTCGFHIKQMGRAKPIVIEEET